MKKLSLLLVLLLCTVMFLANVDFVAADETADSTSDTLEEKPPESFGLTEVEEGETGLQTTSIPTYVATIIQWVLGIIGVLLVALLVYGGVTYMTSAGDEGRVETGKKVITYAIIGIVIVFAAFIISNYVLSALTDDGTSAESGLYDPGSAEINPYTGDVECPGGRLPTMDPVTGDIECL